MSSRSVVLTATFLGLAMGAVGCAADEAPETEDGHFYCTDANGTVVDEDYCDEENENYNSGGGMFFMYMGSSMHVPPAGYSSYPVGHRLPPSAPKFSVADKASRAKFGLPTSGRITNGTVKSGVVGKGGAGSAVRGGGSGGGAKGGSGGG